jgi:hypothetical protein
MVKALFDTNILVDYLNGAPKARAELSKFDGKAISIVTWMEVMVGAVGDLEEPTRAFLSSFQVIALDEVVAERAVALRRAHRMKLPDAIVWASAEANAMLLVTRNTRDFPKGNPGIRFPYEM